MILAEDYNKFIKLFSCCILVNGNSRSVIYDLQREDYSLVPNYLYEIFISPLKRNLNELIEESSIHLKKYLIEYFDFLLENEFAFLCTSEEYEMFPPIDLTLDEPYDITNAIIDINQTSKHSYKKIFIELEELGCRNIQLRFYDSIEINSLIEVLNNTIDLNIHEIDIFIKFYKGIPIQILKKLCKNNCRIRTIYLHSSGKFKVICQGKKIHGNIVMIKDKINKESCGFIHPFFFKVDLLLFSEAKKFNSCLYKKISIDTLGNIKNCPSMNKSFGNCNIETLKNVAKDQEFKRIWYICKDQIKVCKDCEFRYMCSDCRCFIEDKNDIYSKPLKCSYNPYNPLAK